MDVSPAGAFDVSLFCDALYASYASIHPGKPLVSLVACWRLTETIPESISDPVWLAIRAELRARMRDVIAEHLAGDEGMALMAGLALSAGEGGA